MNNYTWVEQSLTSPDGSVVEIREIAGKFNAEMFWRGGHASIRGTGKTVAAALKALDDALMEDCSDEMMKGGHV